MTPQSKPKTLEMDYVEGIDEFIYALPQQQSEPENSSALVASMLKQHMSQHNLTTQMLAEQLDCPLDITQAILTGKLPGHEFDVELIFQIAAVLKQEAHIIALMLGQSMQSPRWDREHEIESKERLATYILDEVSQVLFDTIDNRYSSEIEKDQVRQAQYDRVINELQRIIARQRRELKFVENLINSLKDPKLSVQIELEDDPQEGSSKQLSVINMKKYLTRIVKHLKDFEEVS